MNEHIFVNWLLNRLDGHACNRTIMIDVILIFPFQFFPAFIIFCDFYVIYINELEQIWGWVLMKRRKKCNFNQIMLLITKLHSSFSWDSLRHSKKIHYLKFYKITALHSISKIWELLCFYFIKNNFYPGLIFFLWHLSQVSRYSTGYISTFF